MTVNEKFSKTYFDTAYGPYYELRNPRYKWRAFLREIQKYITKGSLLDIGCAYGLFLKETAEYFECAGTDISEHAIANARSVLPGNIEVFVGAAGSLATDKQYDLVTCFDILEHTKDIGEALDNIYSLLKDNGILAITVPVYDGPLGWLVDRLDKDETHTYRRPRGFWLAEVSKRFEILDHIGIWRYFFFHRYYLNVMSRSTRRITPAMMILARKPVRK
ncbi:MAG: methyltransferase domain-containing protein [Anaerolineales bacterium]|nr:methyltransferase domain-containing protein [Anaerolineales bacterium]